MSTTQVTNHRGNLRALDGPTFLEGCPRIRNSFLKVELHSTNPIHLLVEGAVPSTALLRQMMRNIPINCMIMSVLLSSMKGATAKMWRSLKLSPPRMMTLLSSAQESVIVQVTLYLWISGRAREIHHVGAARDWGSVTFLLLHPLWRTTRRYGKERIGADGKDWSLHSDLLKRKEWSNALTFPKPSYSPCCK